MLLDAVAVRPLALAGMLLGLPLSRRSILLLAHPLRLLLLCLRRLLELLWSCFGLASVRGGLGLGCLGGKLRFPRAAIMGVCSPFSLRVGCFRLGLLWLLQSGLWLYWRGLHLGCGSLARSLGLCLLVLGWVGLPSASAGCCLLPLVCRQGLPAPRSLPRHWLVLAVAVEVEAGQWGLSPGLWLGGVAVWLLLSVLGPVRPPVVLVGFWGAVPPMPRGGVLAPRQLQRVASSLVPGSLLGLLLCVPSAQRGLQRGTEFSPSACKWPPPPPRRLPSVATRVLGGVLTCWVSCLELGAGCGVSAHRLLGQAR